LLTVKYLRIFEALFPKALNNEQIIDAPKRAVRLRGWRIFSAVS
jgi:hypothetical protein